MSLFIVLSVLLIVLIVAIGSGSSVRGATCSPDGTDEFGVCNHDECGASERCDGHEPGYLIGSCTSPGTETYHHDKCDDNCQNVDRDNLCLMTGYADCTGDVACHLKNAGTSGCNNQCVYVGIPGPLNDLEMSVISSSTIDFDFSHGVESSSQNDIVLQPTGYCLPNFFYGAGNTLATEVSKVEGEWVQDVTLSDCIDSGVYDSPYDSYCLNELRNTFCVLTREGDIVRIGAVQYSNNIMLWRWGYLSGGPVCNSDHTNQAGLCDHSECGADLACDGQAPGTGDCDSECMETLTQYTCDDNDPNQNYFFKGTCTDTSPNYCPGPNGCDDLCDNGYIYDFFCMQKTEGRVCVSSRDSCPSGYVCSGGVCVDSPSFCTDDDNGKNLYAKSVCHDNEGDHTDSCNTENKSLVYKYYCEANHCVDDATFCPIGCWNGACISCEDTDRGEDPEMRGVCYDRNHPNGYNDYCQNGEVYEYYCDGTEGTGLCAASPGVACPSGTQCIDGVCLGDNSDPTESLESQSHFTVVVLPDSQNYPAYFPDTFSIQTEWIRDHVDDLNIKFVIHVGDIVNSGGSLREWNNAETSMNILDGVVPYLVIPGNHDFELRSPYRGLTNFNSKFPYSKYQAYSWYKGHYPPNGNQNNYGFFSVGSEDFLLMGLQWDPGTDILTWADDIIGANEDRFAIIFTHWYMNTGNNRGTYGNRIWNSLVSKYSSILMVHSGHVGMGGGQRTDYVDGSPVHQIAQNYQDLRIGDVWWGGGSWLRYYIFKPYEKEIEVKTYSPQFREYNTSLKNHFYLEYPSSVVCGVDGTNEYGICDIGCNADQLCHGNGPGTGFCNMNCLEKVPDLDNDGDVDIDDLGMVTTDFGKTTDFDPIVDIDGDGVIDIFDVVFVAGRFS
jgi:hypothetical protein